MIANKHVKILVLISSLLFLFFAIFPYVPNFSYSYYDHHRLVQIAFLASILVVFLGSTLASTIASGTLKIYLVLICVFLTLGMLSSTMSAEPVDSLMYVLHWLMLFVLMITATVLNSGSHLKRLLIGIVVIHSCVVLISLLNLGFAIFNGDQLVPHVIYYGFDNIRFFNQVQIFVLPLLLVFLKDPRFRSVVSFLLFVNLLLIFVGGGRGALATWICVLGFMYFLNDRVRPFVKHGVFISCIAVLAFLIIDRYLASSTYGLRLEGSSSGRVEMWVGALKNTSASGLIYGDGPGLFAYRLNNLIYSHPHNSLVEIFREWGGLALLILVFLVVSTLMRAIKYLNSNQQDIVTFTVFCSWMSGVGYSLVSGVIVMPVAQTLIFLFWGVLLGRLYIVSDHEEGGAPKKLITTALILIVICTSVYLLLVCKSYEELDELKPAMQGPRFWLSGERNLGE